MEVLISLYCLFRRFRGVRHNSCSVTMVWSECQVSLIGHLETLLSTDVYKAHIRGLSGSVQVSHPECLNAGRINYMSYCC